MTNRKPHIPSADTGNSLSDLAAHRRSASRMGSRQRLDAAREAGRLTARERVNELLDPESFVEIGMLARSREPNLNPKTPAEGVITGSGTIDGRHVFVISDDVSVLAGSRGAVSEAKVSRIRALALRERLPIVMLSEASAARIQETRGAISAGLGTAFFEHIQLSGQVPQVSVMLGASFGGPSFIAAQSDIAIQVEGAFMGMCAPSLVKLGVGQDCTPEEIGGTDISGSVTGQAHFIATDDREALALVRKYLSYMPSSSGQQPPLLPSRPALCESAEGLKEFQALVPENTRMAYDSVRLLELLVDEASLFILHRNYGKSLVTAFARMNGRPVGILASNPRFKAGVVDDQAATKARRFVDLCDAFHIPLLFFTDTPGFLVGPDLEKRRMVSLCARLIGSVFSASVPKITVVLRKAVGMAYIAMAGRATQPQAIFAWPNATFDVMGPEVGLMISHGAAIVSADDPDTAKQELLRQMREEASALATAELALIDDVIAPTETRERIIAMLERSSQQASFSFKHRIDP
ncbi:MAG: acyl-CoA carboxylase subunit beta [Mesorhizobium sp.]